MQTSISKPSYSWAVLVTTLTYLLSLAFQGFDSDLAFWLNWTNEFRAGGYAASTANYPPILLHWFYCGAQILNLLQMPDPSFYLIKTWCQIPVWACHLVLIFQVGRSLETRHIDPYKSGLFWLTVLNPAIILDNPIWGQVDLMVALPLSLAFLAYAGGGNAMWGPFWLALALATKFQAIVFFPLIAGLALRHVRDTIKGIPAAVGVFLLSFAPFFVVGQGVASMARAYWGNMGLYPYATYNAANLWQLVVGDGFKRDQVIFSDLIAQDYPLKLLTPAGMGLALFAICALWVFWRAFNRGEREEWRLALFTFVAFFAFSSDMHERYLFSAVPLAALWAAKSKDGESWYRFFTWVVFVNIAFVLTPKCEVAWNTLSTLVMLGLFTLFLGCNDIKWASATSRFGRKIEPKLKWGLGVSICLLVLQVSILCVYELSKTKVDVPVNQSIQLSDITPFKAGPSHGILRYNQSYNGQALEVGSVVADEGIGAHAPSHLMYQISAGQYIFKAQVGLANESGSKGMAQMSVWQGERMLWQSKIKRAHEEPDSLILPIKGPTELHLRADPLGSKANDHVNWMNMVLQRIN